MVTLVVLCVQKTGDFVTCFLVCFPSDCYRIIILLLFSLNCLFSAEEKSLPFLEVVIIWKFEVCYLRDRIVPDFLYRLRDMTLDDL